MSHLLGRKRKIIKIVNFSLKKVQPTSQRYSPQTKRNHSTPNLSQFLLPPAEPRHQQTQPRGKGSSHPRKIPFPHNPVPARKVYMRDHTLSIDREGGLKVSAAQLYNSRPRARAHYVRGIDQQSGSSVSGPSNPESQQKQQQQLSSCGALGVQPAGGKCAVWTVRWFKVQVSSAIRDSVFVFQSQLAADMLCTVLWSTSALSCAHLHIAMNSRSRLLGL